MKMGVVLLCRRWLLVNGDYTGGFENEMPSIVKAHIDYWYSHSGFYKISQGSLFMFIILKDSAKVEKEGFSLPSSCTSPGMSVFGFCSSQGKYTLESSSSYFIG